MAGSTISINSAEIALTSEMESLSARRLKAAYLQPAGEFDNESAQAQSRGLLPASKEKSGPDATVYLTVLAARVTSEEQKNIPGLSTQDGDAEKTGSVFMMTVIAGIQLDDPATTRFINATLTLGFSPDARILAYSPHGRTIITKIIQSGARGISITPLLAFGGLDPQDLASKSPGSVQHFDVRAGQDTLLQGTYSGKNGFRLSVPSGCLLEYQGMQKSAHQVYWELYSPMIPRDGDCAGKEHLSVFSLIVQTPKRRAPAIGTQIQGRVKGDLWGVIRLDGSSTISVDTRVRRPVKGSSGEDPVSG